MSRQTIPAYPLLFQPIAQERLWGGSKLSTMFHLDDHRPIGEIWTLSDHPSHPSICQNGVLAGHTLTDILSQYPDLYLGDAWTKQDDTNQARFPLLIKFLHAAKDLSVQIHPDDAYGLAHEGDYGKTEAWYVLDAEAGATINYGHTFQNAEQYYAAIESKRVADYLQYVPVQNGDFIFVPSRTLHALLKGTMVIEVQQTSDVTYRVYDWDRVDVDGNARELHIDQAADVMRYDTETASPTPDPTIIVNTDVIHHERLVACEYFTIEKISIDRPSSTYTLAAATATNPEVLIVVDGSFEYTYEHATDKKTEKIILKQGDTVLIPSTFDSYSLHGNGQLLRTYY